MYDKGTLKNSPACVRLQQWIVLCVQNVGKCPATPWQLVSKDTRAPSQPEIQDHPVQAATVAPTCIVSDALSNIEV